MSASSPWTRRRWLRTLPLGALGATLIARRAQAGEERLLEEAESPYNRIQVTEQDGVRTLYFIVDGKRFIESRWDMRHPNSLDLDYSRTMMAGFLLNPGPRRLMMMGLGGGQISNYLFERFPELEIDAVDIDPEVVRLAKKYFGVPDHPRYRCIVDDGRVAIQEGAGNWDMIMLDAFRGVFVPFHLKTQEFYRACLKQLSERGVVVANLHNRTWMYPHDRKTLAAVFPQCYSFVSESGNQTTFVASASPNRIGSYAMRTNARQLRPHFDFDLEGLAARYYLRRDWEKGAQILRDDFSPESLKSAVKRHNRTCVHDCAYSTTY